MSIKSVIQSILMPHDMEPKQQRKWLSEHGFKSRFNGKGAHITEGYYRYRQRNPNTEDDDFITKTIDKKLGIKAIIEFLEPKYKKATGYVSDEPDEKPKKKGRPYKQKKKADEQESDDEHNMFSKW